VGGVVAARQPRNPIGWIFLGAAISIGISGIAHAYAQNWLDGVGGSAALAKASAVYGNGSWIPFILVPATYLLLLFPDGRLVSPRWRPVLWAATIGIAAGFVASILTPGPLEDFPRIENPVGVTAGWLDPVTGLSWLALVVGVGGSAASLVVRFRRAGTVERQQVKWLALSGAFVAVMIPIAILGFDVWGPTGTNVICMLAVLTLPLSAGVAMLRYRLYDIDVVVNRTLVYGALTGLLAGVYLVSVLLLQFVLSPSSDVAVAASTLAVAAVVRPARARIQEVVDRRFFRRRYDAQQAVRSFAARLRSEVSIDAVQDELRAAVGETVQPAHVSLWLRRTA
jgi:hypothetical protein